MTTRINHSGRRVLILTSILLLLMLLFSLVYIPKDVIHASPQLWQGVDALSTSLEQISPSSGNVVGCSQTALADAIDAANAHPDADTIELPATCVLQITTMDDDVDPVYRYNAFSPITTEITINGNGAVITTSNADIRLFQIAEEGLLTVNGLEISGFETNNAGGSVLNQGQLIISNSTFVNNKGRQGGAIFNDGDALIFNSTFTQNSACCCNEEPHRANGGAILNKGSLQILNSTFNNNEVNIKGKHLYNDEGSILLKNSILATTSTSPIYTYGQNCDGTPITDGGGNLRWPTSDASCVGTYGDPKLIPLADNGGLTRSFALNEGSAAIDAAIDSLCAAEPVNNASQNGVTRPHGPHCDVGSFELDYLIVTSVTRTGINPTNAENVDYSVTFSRPVIGVDLTDFALTLTDLTEASVSNVSGADSTYVVTVNTGIGSGTLRLDVVDDDSIRDSVTGDKLGMEGNGNGDYTLGEVYTIDKDPPLVSAITTSNTNPTKASFVSYLVTFSKPVSGVDATDFQLRVEGITDALILAVLKDSDEAYTVNVSTGTGSGTLQLDLIDDDSIIDPAGNPLGGNGLENGDYTEGEVYIIDRLPPIVSSISTISQNPSFSQFVDFEVTFSEVVSGVDLDDFTLTISGLTQASLTAIIGSDTTYIITVNTGVGDGTIRLDLIDDDSILDLAQNPLGGDGLKNGNFVAGETYTIIDSPIFTDVPTDHWAIMWIERLYRAGITKGCQSDPLSYCPQQNVTRAEMAAFLLRGIYGEDHIPPLGSGYVFIDVPFEHPFVNWIEQLYEDEITTGCKEIDGKLYFCPNNPVSRAEMAVFLLRAKHYDTVDYQPPQLGEEEGTGFDDVPATHWAAAWIRQLADEGITTGCSENMYCPEQSVTRAEMAVFLVRTFNLP